jgi:uncharacterized damage-inducible protein DinB
MSSDITTFHCSMSVARLRETATLCRAVVEGLSAEQLRHREGLGYSPLWTLAHVAAFRVRALAAAGDPAQEPSWVAWGYAPERGAAPIDAPERVLEAISRVGDALCVRLAMASDARMRKEVTHVLKGVPTTLAENLSFVVWHEAMHLGQLAQMRHALGLDPLF